MNCCSAYNSADIYREVYSLKTRAVALTDSILSKQEYGYGCEAGEEEELRDIKYLLRAFSRWECWGCKQLQSLVEQSKLIHRSFCNGFDDIAQDVSKRQVNVLMNKGCVPHETYERAAYELCEILNIKFKVEEYVCDVAYDLVVKNLSCDLLYALKVTQEYCDMGYKLKYTPTQCEINYKTLVDTYKCKLTYKTYMKLLECGMSHTAVVKAVECNLNLKVRKNDVVLCSPTTEYVVSALQIEAMAEQGCKDCGIEGEMSAQEIKEQIKEEFQ